MKCTVSTTQRTLVTAVLGIALLGSANVARAHEDPPGCFQTGPAIIVSVFRANGTTGVVGAVSECETINYKARLQKATDSDEICAFSQGSFGLTTPDGVVHTISANVPCIGGTDSAEGCTAALDFVESALIPYTVDTSDIVGGLITATAQYAGGVAHDQVVNTPGVAANTPKSTPVVLCTDNNLCTSDVCDPTAVGALACSNPVIPCTDNNLCTTEQCNPATGICANTSTVTCTDNNACTTEACNPASGQCETTNTVTCTDNNACTTESCNTSTGQCQTTSTVTCTDNNACTTESCNTSTGQCQTTSTVTCTDNNACTTESCNTTSGLCQTTNTVQCNDNNACTTESCNPANGQCQTTNTVTCTDNNACTTESCNPANGQCETSNTVTCTDNNACTTESCNTTTGTCQTTNTVTCTDNNACTTESCNPATGQCQTTNTVTCNDNSLCTTEACNPATGMCVFTPVTCNDGSLCTIDSCNPSTGCATTPVICNDNNQCTVDSCVAATGCVNTPINVPTQCNDNNVCTTDTCDPATGCKNTGGALNCNDNNACTTDVCDPVEGCKHTDKVCNDNDVCTDDSCNPQTGQCVFTPAPDNDPSCEPVICRTPGFWGTHGGVSQAVITYAGGCLEVCGEVIKNNTVASADSALEAICVSPRGDGRLQLARQLTSMALNCVMSDRGIDCGAGTNLGDLFAECNDACRGAESSMTVGDCIEAVDCFNNGGAIDDSGLCGPDPFGSCHERALPSFLPKGGADTPQACNAARKNSCSVIPPYEQAAGVSGCTAAGTETLNGAETCN